MASYLKPRRGTYSTAESKLRRSSDGVLKNGEIFFELNNSGAGKGVGKIKMGDGSTDYSSLPYFLSLQDSPITFTATESTDQISSLVSGVTIPNAFRYIKSSLAYLKTQVTNLNNDLTSVNSRLMNAIGGGFLEFGTINAGGSAQKTVTFTEKFIQPPSVVATINHQYTDLLKASVYNITQTQCTVRVFNTGSIACDNVVADWIAVCFSMI